MLLNLSCSSQPPPGLPEWLIKPGYKHMTSHHTLANLMNNPGIVTTGNTQVQKLLMRLSCLQVMMKKRQLRYSTLVWFQKLPRSMWHTLKMDKSLSYRIASKPNHNFLKLALLKLHNYTVLHYIIVKHNY